MSSLEKYKETSTLEIIKNQWKEFIKLFLKKEQIDIEEQQREEAVSYTHLDVYKRQILCYIVSKIAFLRRRYHD